MPSRRVRAAAALALMLPAWTSTLAQVELRLELVAGGFIRPIAAVHAPGDGTRLYVAEQLDSQFVPGRADIRVVNLPSGAIEPMPFLTLTGLADNGEQGLLGLAFHPQFATNGHFFVNYTRGDNATVVQRFTAISPTHADPNSAHTLMVIPQPFPNHNAGWMDFGPDGMLYIASGDGGSGGDPFQNAQNPFSRLGKLLRIDVDGDDFPADPLRNYAVPPDNPFAAAGGAPEVWALGLRNPWRNSFDRATGDLLIADVGQAAREEVNFQPAHVAGSRPGEPGHAGGRNYGWNCEEGDICYPFFRCDPCPSAEFVKPIHWYPTGFPLVAVVGGQVYRGCRIPGLRGHYLFADFLATIWTFNYTGGPGPQAVTDRTRELTPRAGVPIPHVSSFGEAPDGELYIVDWGPVGGRIFRVVPLCDGDLDGNGVTDQVDLGILLGAFGVSDAGDLNCDGVTDQIDLGILLGGFGCGG